MPPLPADVTLTAGAGLDGAPGGCEVLVDASNDSSGNAAATPVGGTRRLLAAGRLLVAFARRPPAWMRAALVNGAPGLVMRDADGVPSVLALTVDAGRVTAIDVIRDPDKLAAVRGFDRGAR